MSAVPPTLADMVRTAREAGDINRFIGAIPYARFLGISASAEGGVLTARLASSDKIIGNPALPAIHGGVVGAFLENPKQFNQSYMWSFEYVKRR